MEPQRPSLPTPQPAQPGSMPAPIPAAAPASAAAQPVAAAPSQPAPLAPEAPIKDDSDTIEIAWVNRIQDIFKTNVQDPAEQSRQFMLLKSEYLQKRYGRTMKVEE